MNNACTGTKEKELNRKSQIGNCGRNISHIVHMLARFLARVTDFVIFFFFYSHLCFTLAIYKVYYVQQTNKRTTMNNLYIQKCVLYCGLVKSYSVHLFCFQILSKCLCFLDLLSSSPILYIKYCKFYFIRQSRNTICVHSFPHTHTHTPFWLKQNSQFISNMIPNAKKSTATMHFGLNLCFVPLYFHVCIISLAPPPTHLPNPDSTSTCIYFSYFFF